MVNQLPEIFIKKNCKKQIKKNKKQLRIEKVIKRKGEKFYHKWKIYDNSFNSCINKKDLEWSPLI